jgi:hypothetical protein
VAVSSTKTKRSGGSGGRSDHDAPGRPQELVAFARAHRSFFRVHPRRLSARQSVESLTKTPKVRRRNSRLWGNVAPPGAPRGRPPGASWRLRPAWAWSRGGVALDAGEAHAEGPGDLEGGHALFFGLDDLLPQVQRVGVHECIVPHRPTTLQNALKGEHRAGGRRGPVSLARRGLCVQQRPLLAASFSTKLHAKCCSRSMSSKQAGGPFLRS